MRRSLPRLAPIRLAALLAAIVAASCQDPEGQPQPSPAPLGGNDGGVCARPAPGCPCEEGERPVDCYLSPIENADGLLCRRGTYVCQDGTWSTCQDVRQYEISVDKTLGTPTSCNYCNPDCQSQTSIPNASDLTPTNSNNVGYSTTRPGLVVNLTGSSGTANLPDGDGDGTPDVADDCPGQPGFRTPCDNMNTLLQDGFYFTLTPSQTGTGNYPPINLQLRSADLYVMMDTTGSMAGELSNVQANLTSGTLPQGTACAAGMGTGMLGAVRCTIPDVSFGVGMAREYPNHANGDDYLVPYLPLLDSTTNFSRAQSVINAFNTMGNGEGWPESTGQALYSMASGRGLSRWLPNRGACPNSGVGYPCFRTTSVPIALVITDAPFRQTVNGGNYASRYTVGAENLPPAVTTDASGAISIRQAESFASALDLGDLTTRAISVLGSTRGMTNDHTAGCSGGGSGPDFVVKFTLTATKTMTFRTEGSDFDGMLYLYNSNSTPGLIECDDDDGGITDGDNATVYPYASKITRSLGAGTYYLVVDGYSGSSSGAVQLRIFNDSTAGSSTATAAVPISWANVTSSLNSIGAKTIGIATCPYCDTATYDTCRAGSTTWGFCTSAYNQCITTNGSGSTAVTNCTAIRNACNNSVNNATSLNCSSLPKAAACEAARVRCTSNYNNTTCNLVKTTCNAGADACLVQQTAYCTCYSAASTQGDAFDYCPATLADLRAMGNATSSVDSSGQPFVYQANPDGTGLSNTIVDAIINLAQYLRLDVDVVCVDNPATPINECTVFTVTAPPNATPSACPSTCTGGRSANACLDCAPGSNLSFAVNVTNTGVPQTTVAQVFNFNLIARADATIEILRVPIRVVVPPDAPVPPNQSGTFNQAYAASARCTIPPQRPDWNNFTYTSDTPAGTQITFSFRTGDSAVAAASATPVNVTVSTTSMPGNPLDVGNLLVAAGQANYKPYLSVTATLTANMASTLSPALTSWSMSYTCVDLE